MAGVVAMPRATSSSSPHVTTIESSSTVASGCKVGIATERGKIDGITTGGTTNKTLKLLVNV